MRSSALSAARRLVRPSAVILMYHSVVTEPELAQNILGLSKSDAVFEAHMKTLARQFTPVTIEQIAEFARDGANLPPRAVAVTFDDGFADNYDVALPILNRYDIPATFYIMVNAVATGGLPWYCRLRFAFNTTSKPEWRDPEQDRVYQMDGAEAREKALNLALETGARTIGDAQEQYVRHVEESLEVDHLGIQRRFMLTWEKVKALRNSGHIIGAHTLSHPNLAHVSEGDARSEIVGSKKRLEREIGEPIDHFSYPHPALNPQWSLQTLEITRETGFKSAVLTTCGPVRVGDEALGLKRIYAASDLDQWIWNLQCAFLGRSI